MSSIKSVSTQDHEQLLRPLLDYLTSVRPSTVMVWQSWRITSISGGYNNLLYRVAGANGDFAVKFTIRDRRDRAGREYNSLLTLQQAGLSIAPQPILLDRDRYPQPVVVQSWLDGMVSSEPPVTDADWQNLVQHLATIHQVTPAHTQVSLPSAYESAVSVEAGRQLVAEQVRRIPLPAQPDSLQQLLAQFDTSCFSSWPKATTTLCRGDSNISNIIRRDEAWGSVDWEYSGWGDPAFEVGEMMAHPTYIKVSASRWRWVVETYCDLVGDSTIAVRILTYYKIMLVWWVARLARYHYEIPRGLDQRLAHRPSDWVADLQNKYDHYLKLAVRAGEDGCQQTV